MIWLAKSYVVLCAMGLLCEDPAPAKAPVLTSLFPAGSSRGETVTVTATGGFDTWPPKIWTDREGLTISAAAEKGKFSVQVDPKAELGIVRVRLYNDAGASELRPFVIGTLPEIEEIEPNNHPRHPQPIDRPSVTLNGKLNKTGDVDGFSIVLKQGQTLVADLEANRRLGSPMDAVLQLVSSRGFVFAQNHDTQGLDPRIVFAAPADGSYTVRVFAFPASPDSSIQFSGSDLFIYRLTLTTGPFLDQPFPLAISRSNTPASLGAVGWNLADARVHEIPKDDGRDSFTLSDPGLAGTALVRRIDGEVVEERESNDLSHPQEISSRGVVSGQIDSPGDQDVFEVALKKGEVSLFRVESKLFGFPLDATLRILDSTGKTLAEADDTGEVRDPELTFTAPEDGRYRIVIADLYGHGGPRFAYLLHQRMPDPDFTLTVATDRFDVTREKPLSVAVTIDRKYGFGDMIEVSAEDLPAGLVASPVYSKRAGDSAKTVTLEIRAEGDIVAPGPFRIIGKRADRKSRANAALATIPGDTKTDRLWVTLLPVAPPPKEK